MTQSQPPLTHSITHSITHSLTQSLTHSLTHFFSPGTSLYPNSHGGGYDMMGAPDFDEDDYVVGENLSSNYDHDDLVHIRR